MYIIHFDLRLICLSDNSRSLFVLQISDASGTMKVSSVAESSPFKQAMLSPEECYIVDNGVDKNIFVWKGADSIADSHNTKWLICSHHCIKIINTHVIYKLYKHLLHN